MRDDGGVVEAAQTGPQGEHEQGARGGRRDQGGAQAAQRDGDLHEDGAERQAEVHERLEDGEEAGHGIDRRRALEERAARDVEDRAGEAGRGQQQQGEGDVLLDADERQGGNGGEEGEHERALEPAPPDQEGGDEARQERAGTERRVEVARTAGAEVEVRGGQHDAEQVDRADQHVIEGVQREEDAQRWAVAQRRQVGAHPGAHVGQDAFSRRGERGLRCELDLGNEDEARARRGPS